MASTRVGLILLVLVSVAAADDVAALAAQLKTDRAHEAADRLADLGPGAKEAVPQLVAALQSEDDELRWRAAWALSRIGRDAAPAAPALVLAALKEDGLPAASAYIALKRMGGPATDAVLASMRQAPEDSRAKYVDLLRNVEPKPEATVPLLLPLLSSDDEMTRWKICAILKGFGQAAAPAVPTLVRQLANTRWAHAEADTLVAIGEASVAPLREMALEQTATSDARGAAIGVLVQIRGSGVVAAKECLQKPDHDVWDAFLLRTRRVGPEAAPLVPVIEQQLFRSWDLPSGIVRMLLSLGPAGEAAVERALFERPNDDAVVVDRRADLVRQLGGKENERVVAWLFRLAEPSQPKKIRVAALRELAETPLDAAASLRAAAIVENAMLDDVVAACRLAGHLGTAWQPLAEKLRPLLKDSDPRVQAYAASALCAMGKGGPAEVAILREAVKNWYGFSAVEVLVDAGPVCLDLLLDAVENGDFVSHRVATKALLRMLPALREDKPRVLEALRKDPLWLLGATELNDVRALVDLLPYDEIGSVAGRLVALGSSAREPLVECLESTDELTRTGAAAALVRIDPDGAGERAWALALGGSSQRLDDLCRNHRQVAIPILMRMLTDNDATTRARAAYLLGELVHRDAAQRLRALVAQDPDPTVRFSALWALDAVLQPQ